MELSAKGVAFQEAQRVARQNIRFPITDLSLMPFPGGYPVSMRLWTNLAVLLSNAFPINLSTGVAQGNFLTRNFRQKTFLDNNMAGPKNYKSKGMSKAKVVKKGTKPKSKPRSKAVAMNSKNKTNVKTKAVAPKNSIKGVNQQLVAIKKALAPLTATHLYKRCDATAITASAMGKCAHTLIEPLTPTLIETYMANFRFFDPNVSGLVTKDYSTGTYAKDVTVKNIHSKLNFGLTNNTPAYVRIYLCKAKRDTANSPIDDYTNGIADQVISAGSTTSALLYLTDIERVRENWDIDCVFDQLVVNGQQWSVSHNTGEFKYDPAVVDSESQKYQKRHKAFAWVVRVEGTIGHDNTTPFARTIANVEGVDCTHTIKADFVYDAGVQLNDIYITENRASSGTSIIVGVPCVPDNIAASFS